jgi:uncharacterized membrane protein (DUF485 family)
MGPLSPKNEEDAMQVAHTRPEGHAGKSAHEVIESADFKALVRTRWTVSAVMLALLFLSYYGFILLIAADKPLVSARIGAVTTLAIPLGIGSIVAAWILTGVYVWWANRKYDPEVARLKGQLER